MSCEGMQRINPLCRAKEIAQQSTESAFSHTAHEFGTVAQAATNWLWHQIGTATRIDLNHLGDSKPLMATATIGLVLCLGLFVLQVITSVLRQEPGGLLRAVKGLVVSLVGTSVALGTTVLLLAAVDRLSAGVVRYTMGTNLHGLGQRLALGQLATIQSPAGTLLFSIVILAAVVIVWAALMIRKMMILIAAVLAPLAFAGATADVTRGWVRKWVEFVAAMIASKLLLVIILSIGVSVLDGYGQSGDGATQTTTQLAAGTLILLLGGLAPWMAVKTFHFAGDSLYAAHATAAGSVAGGHAVVAAPRKVAALQANTRALSRGARAGGAHRLPTGQPPDPQQVGSPPPPSTGPDPRDAANVGGSTLPVKGETPAPAVSSGQAARSVAGGTGASGSGSATTSGTTSATAASAAAPAVVPAALAAGTVKSARGVATATGDAMAKTGSTGAATVNAVPSTTSPARGTPTGPIGAPRSPEPPTPAADDPPDPQPPPPPKAT